MSGAPARVGVDVVHVPSLARRLAESPGLANLLFTAAESAAAGRTAAPSAALAAAFAAKEALLKALHRGLQTAGPDGALRQVEVVEDAARGGVRLRLSGPLAARVARGGWSDPLLALTRSGDHALATVLLLPDPAGARAPARRTA